MYFSDPNGLAAALQTFRKKKGLTQKEVAERACIKQSTVSKAENDVSACHVATLFKLFYVLGLQVQLVEKSELAKKLGDAEW